MAEAMDNGGVGGASWSPSVRRFWLDEHIEDGQSELILQGDVLHHIRDVCRMSVGARFEVLTQDRCAWFVEIQEMGKKQGVAKILEQRALPEIHGPRLHLAVSLPKFATFESILEKSVELGVHSIQPFFSDFSFIKTANKISPSRTERWQKIVRSATQQSGRGELMPVAGPIKLSDVLKKINQNSGLKGLFAYEGSSHHSLREELLLWDGGNATTDVLLFVGSEGGFSSQEVELFQQHGLAPITLGEQILRVETACVALVSIIKYHLNALG